MKIIGNNSHSLIEGDITSVGITADDGNTISFNDSDITFTISGEGGISTNINGDSGDVEIAHSDTSSQASVDNSGRTFIQDITLDTYGHVTGITSATDSDTHVGDITSVSIAVDDGGSLETVSGAANFSLKGAGGIGTDVHDDGYIEISHSDTSSQASVNNSGRTYIQDITLDTYGHVTGLTSATETVTNTDTDSLFNINTLDHEEGDREVIRLSATNNTDHASTDVTLAVGTGLSIANDADSNTITITNTVSDTNTQLSNSQVRSAVEAATDSNVFTDADHTKLNGIASSANNYSLPSANETTVGGVELATTAEASTGTDTARAVTPAGLKSHVDARYSYQYLNFSFKVSGYVSGTWNTPSQNGPEYYLWNNTHGTSGNEPASHVPNEMIVNESADEQEYYIEVDYLDQTSGFVIPKACRLVGFYGNCKHNLTSPTSARPVVGLFKASEPSDRNNSDIIATCVAIDKYDTSSGVNMKNRFLKLETTVDQELAQGDILFPAAGLDVDMDNNDTLLWGSFTIILKTLMP